MSESKEEYNRGGMNAFIFSMVFILAFFIYLITLHPGVDLGEKIVDPNAPVAASGEAAFDISTVSEPWVSDPKIVAYGAKVFATNCAMCHGAEGKGDGAAGAGLNPKPRNLVEGKWTQGGGQIGNFKVVSNGISGTSMAGYAHFKAADRWALVQFIESITQNKSKDTPEQIAEFAKSAK